MRLTAFFKGVSIVLAVALTQMATAFESSAFVKEGVWGVGSGEWGRRHGDTGMSLQNSPRHRVSHSPRLLLPLLSTPHSPLQNQAVVRPSLFIAQQSRTQRIQFVPGAVSAVVEGGVVRGTREIYLLRARKGQTMTLNITSVEQNAVFDVQAPNGTFLQEEATRWSGVLPSTGDYSVIVSGTRGNASYTLEVTIR